MRTPAGAILCRGGAAAAATLAAASADWPPTAAALPAAQPCTAAAVATATAAAVCAVAVAAAAAAGRVPLHLLWRKRRNGQWRPPPSLDRHGRRRVCLGGFGQHHCIHHGAAHSARRGIFSACHLSQCNYCGPLGGECSALHESSQVYNNRQLCRASHRRSILGRIPKYAKE